MLMLRQMHINLVRQQNRCGTGPEPSRHVVYRIPAIESTLIHIFRYC